MVLLCLSVASVVVAALSGSWLVATLCALLAAALGGAATRIAFLETIEARVEAAHDRAAQAQAYRVLTEERLEENTEFVVRTQGEILRRQTVIDRLELRLEATAGDLAEARRELAAMGEQLEEVVEERDRLAVHLDDAQERAAMAIVRVAELEQEYDIVLAQFHASQASGQRRKHA